MPLPLNLRVYPGISLLTTHYLGFHEFSQLCCPRVPLPIHLPELHNKSSLYRSRRSRPCLSNGSGNSYGLSDAHNFEAEQKESRQGQPLTSKKILEKLRRYGISGILSYGLLNTAYYLTTFVFVWFYVAPASGKMGYVAAVQRLLKVFAMVWAGSQVTKLFRVGGALAMAPFVDRGLSWFTNKFGFESQGKAFAAIALFCFAIAFLIFVVLTLLWA